MSRHDQVMESMPVKHPMQLRFQRQIAFVRARLSADGVFGLYFTLGAVAFAGGLWLFGGISEDLIMGDPLIAVDELISEWFRSHANPEFSTGMRFASALASAATVGFLSAVMAGIFLSRRLWYWLAGLVTAVGGGMLLNVVLKNLFDRARPGWADPLLALTDPGFPSGHTMMATIMYGVVAVYLMLEIASWRWRIVVAATTVLLVFVVALSRMYLGAHYLSDVLAAMAAGIAWLALCLTAVETWRRYRGVSLSGGRS